MYDTPCEIIRAISELIGEHQSSPDAYTSILYALTHKLFSDSEQTRDLLSDIKRYIEYNYMDNISVSAIAREYGYERSHLYRLFAMRYGVGVKEYLTEVRMTRAKDFLSLGHTVSETAYLIGFRDGFAFSRAFKKHFGVPPSKLKKSKDNFENFS